MIVGLPIWIAILLLCVYEQAMIGSLQEFLGKVDEQTFFDFHHRPKQPCQRTHRTRSLQNSSKQPSVSLDKPPKATPNISTVKYHPMAMVSQTFSQPSDRNAETVRPLGKEVTWESLRMNGAHGKNSKWTMHAPQSRKPLLKAFAHLGRKEDSQNNMKIMDKLRESSMQTSMKQTKRPSQMHLKGPLKHEHQLLRSIQRVQAENLINPRTFLELSIESLSNSYSKIRVKPELRCDGLMPEQQPQKEINKYDLFQGNDVFLQSLRRRQVGKKSMARLTHRILMENERKWSKTRAKSSDSHVRSLGKEGRGEETVRLKKDRKDLLKRVSDLVDGPVVPMRKSSIMSSSKLYK